MSNLPEAPAARNYIAPGIATAVPSYLAGMKRWTAWVLLQPKKAGGKFGKKPVCPTNDSGTWRTFTDALSEARTGIGFQMLGVTSICGIDIDGCLDPTTGSLNDFATALLAALPDTYAEVTPSGKGLRLFALVPEGMKVPEFTSPQGVECYIGRSARFLTVTGNALPGREGQIADLTPGALRLLTPFAASTGGGVDLEIKLPVPTFERLPNWQELLEGERLSYKKLKQEWRTYLEKGDLPGGRSEKTFAIAAKLLDCRYLPDEVFAILISAPGSWEAALDKRDRDVTRARALVWADIGRAQKVIRADEMALQERVDDWSGLGLRTEIKGKRVCVQRSQSNAIRILTDHPDWRGRVALDITTGAVMLDNIRLDDWRFFDLQEKLGLYAGWEPYPNRQWWADLIRAVAERNPINPRETEIRSLVWDGKSRLDDWFVDHVADEDCKLNRQLGRKWLISLIARWLQPGCKVDTVLILQGMEGARKNTFFEVIAGGVERVIACDGMERDDKFTIASAWIAEMPEASIFKRADRNRLKGFITQPIDNYRPPYAANPVGVKRAFVLVATSNANQLFNADQDGLRRFWPVWVRKRIDYEWVAANRGQLLAEATVAYDLGEEWWFEDSPDALRERVEFAVEATALDEAILDLIHKRIGKGGMGLTEIAVELGATLGYRPNDKAVATLLEKHQIRRRRTDKHRFWLHPSWARPGVAGEGDAVVLPFPGQEKAVEESEEVKP